MCIYHDIGDKTDYFSTHGWTLGFSSFCFSAAVDDVPLAAAAFRALRSKKLAIPGALESIAAYYEFRFQEARIFGLRRQGNFWWWTIDSRW